LKSLMLLWEKVALEMATRCNTSATMDIKYVQGRSNNEGLSFLTITLPRFGKDTQKCLDQGWVDRCLFQGFSWKGGLPKFLSGFLGLVFDRSTGVLLNNPDVEAVFALRQLSLMFGKMQLPCTPAREMKAFDTFVQCEQDVKASWNSLSSSLKEEFQRTSGVLFGRMFLRLDHMIQAGDLLPKHGPGAVAEKYSSNEKYFRAAWTRRLEDVLPSGDNVVPNSRFWRELGEVDILEPGSEIPVRVVSVPKTLETPRIIAIEPTAMQYAQQALLYGYLETLSKDVFLKEMIGIDDQQPNQLMAQEGSEFQNLATLDLSEASDRVSNQHVRLLVGNHQRLRTLVDASRSRKADIPRYGIRRLAKYASMGSATCFPMEASVFLTLIFMGISRALNTPVDRSLLSAMVGRVRVYGDDIIIPVECVGPVISVLEAFGFVVNRNKSFWTGRFRESCGKEYYDSCDVSVAKVRNFLIDDRRHVAEVISTVSLRNQLYMLGLWQTVKWLDSLIARKIKFFPTVSESSPVLGRHSFLGYETQRMSPTLHSPLVKGYVVKGRPPVDELDGHGALVKYLIKRGIDPLSEGHLERAGRPQAVYTKLRWSSPF
jgi:hypothetical protein